MNATTPLAAVVVSVPPHCGVEELPTVNPAGSVSVKLMPVKVVAVFGLEMEKAKVVVLPVKMGFAVKDFEITGGCASG